MADITDQTTATPDQKPVATPAPVTPAPAPKSSNTNPITSMDKAQSLARLIKDGKITGAGRDRALADLREFHNSVEYEKTAHGDVKNPVERMGTLEKIGRGFGEGASAVGRGIRQLGAEAGEAARNSSLGAGIAAAAAPLTGGSVALNQDDPEALKAKEDQIRASASRQALLNTKSGKFGEVLGQSAATAPTALIPGAGSLGGAALIGAGLGAAQPVGTNDSRVVNAAGGAIGGVAGKYMGEGMSALAGKAAAKVFPKSGMNAQVSMLPKGVRTEAARALQNNYKLPPSMAKRDPNMVEDLAEGVGGKIRTEQRFSMDNQINSNRIARRDIGMRDEGAETENIIRKRDLIGVRNREGANYQKIRDLPIEEFSPRSRAYYGDAYYRGDTKLNPTPTYKRDINRLSKDLTKYSKDFPNIFKNDKVAGVLEDLKKPMSTDDMVEISNKLRRQASANFRSTNGDRVDLAFIQKRGAEAVDKLLETHLKTLRDSATNPATQKMFDDLIKSRETIAKTYDIQSALTPGGNIDAAKLARIAEKRPLSGGLADIAHFGAFFPGAARVPTRVGSRYGPSVSKTEIGAGVISSFVNPHGGAKAATKEILTVASPMAARKALGSKAYQSTLKPRVTTMARERTRNILNRTGTVLGPQATRGWTLNNDDEEQQK